MPRSGLGSGDMAKLEAATELIRRFYTTAGAIGGQGNAAFQPLLRAVFDVVPPGQLVEAQASARKEATDAKKATHASASLVVDMAHARHGLLDLAVRTGSKLERADMVELVGGTAERLSKQPPPGGGSTRSKKRRQQRRGDDAHLVLRVLKALAPKADDPDQPVPEMLDPEKCVLGKYTPTGADPSVIQPLAWLITKLKLEPEAHAATEVCSRLGTPSRPPP